MLHEFLNANRATLIGACRKKVARRRTPKATDGELEHGIPLFLEQLVTTLRREDGGSSDGREMGASAARHGHELLEQGFTVEQVVHDYGDLCQAITDLAFERHAPIAVEEFRTLNRCLDNAIADAVGEFGRRRDIVAAGAAAQALTERLGFLSHELRDLVNTATLAVAVIKEGRVGLTGATGAVLDRSLAGLRRLVDRSLADVRVSAGLPPRRASVALEGLIGEVAASAALEARARGCAFSVAHVDPALTANVDREMLLSALGSLLQNAFKFTRPEGEVSLRAGAEGGRILIEVEDRCGGLASGDAERMFVPFAPGEGAHSGLGLGLSICRRSVEANDGTLEVRDLPGTGCVFTIDLPQQAHASPGGRA